MRKANLALTLIFSIILIPFTVHAVGVHRVDGHWRDGTWVESHYRTNPDGYEGNNLGSDGIDMDNDGYGAGEVNDLYDHNHNNVYDGHEYDSYNYDSYNYDSGLDSYDTYNYDTGYDSYETNYGSYDSYDYDTGYDSYETNYGGYNNYDSGW